MKFQIFIFFVLFFSVSCQDPGSSKEISKAVSKDILDSSLNRNDSSERYAFIKFKQQIIGLDSIQSGYDTLQIRVWDIQGLFGHMQLYVIKNNGKKWTADYYSLELDSNYVNGNSSIKYEQGNEPFSIIEQKRIKPTMPWNRFIDSLVSFEIMTLPDMDSIKGMQVEWTDAGSIIIEVALRNCYRVYHYSDPWRFEEFKEAQNMMGILSLISTELK